MLNLKDIIDESISQSEIESVRRLSESLRVAGGSSLEAVTSSEPVDPKDRYHCKCGFITSNSAVWDEHLDYYIRWKGESGHGRKV